MSAVLTPTLPSTFTPAPVVVPPVTSPPPPTWQPFRWTIDQYRELYKTGLFNDVKTMLIHGEVYVMANAGPDHDLALGRSEDTLRLAFATGFHLRGQMGFNVGTDSDPSPDIAVISGRREDLRGRTPTIAALIVEVSESSLFDDTTRKAELYATAGVEDYWVVDILNRLLLVYRDPVPLPAGLGATAYRSHAAYGPAASVSPLAAPTASIRVADLLP